MAIVIRPRVTRLALKHVLDNIILNCHWTSTRLSRDTSCRHAPSHLPAQLRRGIDIVDVALNNDQCLLCYCARWRELRRGQRPRRGFCAGIYVQPPLLGGLLNRLLRRGQKLLSTIIPWRICSIWTLRKFCLRQELKRMRK
jgi:hypothetical protein